jgi:hypothetical protein
MATKITKKLTRELLQTDRFGRTLLIELNPDDTISFRLKGKKTRYTVSLLKCFNMAIVESVLSEYKEKADTYKLKKDIGYKRIKRPKKPQLGMVNKWIQKIL